MKVIKTPPWRRRRNPDRFRRRPGGPVSSEAPPIPANDLYDNAMRDKGSGKLDLALQEFTDYLKWYGNTELAPNASSISG